MKRKYMVMLLMFVVSVLCVGCDIINADTTRDIRHSGFSLAGTEFECSQLLPSRTGYEQIKYLTASSAITTDGSVYLLSFSQKFSNNSNCMKANFSLKVTSVFDNKVIKASDNKLYYLEATGGTAAFSLVPDKDSNYDVYKTILSEDGVLKVVTVSQESGSYYVLKSDGNVYNYVLNKNNGKVSISSRLVVYSKNSYGGNIIDFNYAGQSPGTFVRTSNQIHRMLATNKEECSKYVDITCKYEMGLDEGLTEHIDKILGFNGSLLITTYGKEFNASN